MKKLTTTKGALTLLGERLNVNPEELKATLKATVCKPAKVKNRDGSIGLRPITDAEFISFIAVANTYKLNPITKEIYAYPDKGAVIPIVSTDGWNKLMTTHPNYKTHNYRYSEDIVTLKGAKPCPEWIEIIIEQKDGSSVTVREYLDECFRDSQYVSPWQTHTKRMLRHKAKIQGAREAFGFGGIYDQDEGERIIEGQVAAEAIEEPKAISDQGQEEPQEEKPKTNGYGEMLKKFAEYKKIIGEETYYNLLKDFGFEKANQIKTISNGNIILERMEKVAKNIKK